MPVTAEFATKYKEREQVGINKYFVRDLRGVARVFIMLKPTKNGELGDI